MTERASEAIARPTGSLLLSGQLPVAFRTLGCKVNRVESEDIAADLLGRGAALVPESDAAVVVVNTCTVTGEADAKARKAVRQALKAAMRPLVVVTGCLAAVDGDALRAIDDRVVVEADKERVADRVAELLGLADEPHGHAVRAGEGFRTRSMLKIEDGCDNFCTYCIVPYARGVPRGVPAERVIAEARRLVGAGSREIVLTGINIGRYSDAGQGTRDIDLAGLIEMVAATGVSRLRLSSIEPPDLTPRLLSVIAETPAVCPHLHVPLQSGSDAVLHAMHRGYDTRKYAELIESAREAMPGLAVTTDVMAGFPGETESQAAETLAFVERIGFSRLHVFRYSQRPGTPASAMEQVPSAIRASRAASLRELGESLRSRYVNARSGQSATVLVESVDECGAIAIGTTEDYLRVEFPACGCAVGDLVAVSLGGKVAIAG